MLDKEEIALVTGASAGIGAEFCRQLASRCKAIILVGRRLAPMEALAEELVKQGVECHVLAVDLAEPLGVTRVVETIRQKGPVSILVNNAGFSTLGNFADVDLEAQEAMVSVHINATLRLTRAVLPYMRELGRGSVINLSSMASFFAMPGIAVYGASKVFLNAFSESLQQEEASNGIRVQCLCPGYTRTEFHGRDSFAGFEPDKVPDQMWMEARDVVAESLAELDREGSPVVWVTGEENRKLVANVAGRKA